MKRPEKARKKRPASTQLMWPVLCAMVLLLGGGCAGYHLGPRKLDRPDIHTVYVPIFKSDSFRRNMGEQLTEAVVREIEARTHYKVVSSPNADSVLAGRIQTQSKRIISQTITNQPRQTDVRMLVEITWTDCRGDLLNRTTSVEIPPSLMNAFQRATMAPEGGQSMTTANQEAIAKLAREIVFHMEMPW